MSPTVRRLRLAVALEEERTAAGLTPEALAKLIGYSRMKISRLEVGKERPREADVMKVLDVLRVDGARWAELVAVAYDAAHEGWWSAVADTMGERQALRADLEWTASIREYQQLIPGLLQTRAFAMHRHRVAGLDDRQARLAVEGRMMRQKRMGPHHSEHATYAVVLDEIAVRRLAAPPEIVAEQLELLVALAEEPRYTIRVLPVDARIKDYRLPRVPFSIFDYPDPGDPQAVAVDTVTEDLLLTTLHHQEHVTSYVALYGRLADASLSTSDSTELLSRVAHELREGAT